MSNTFINIAMKSGNEFSIWVEQDDPDLWKRFLPSGDPVAFKSGQDVAATFAKSFSFKDHVILQIGHYIFRVSEIERVHFEYSGAP